MIPLRLFTLFFVLLIASLAGIRCSSLGGGGGTETGNPGMTACAAAVFEELESRDRWTPVTYLAGGEKQLDPTSYLASKPILVAKRSATMNDTITPDSTNTILIRYSVDTIIVIDTMFVRDTVYKDTTKRETLVSDSLQGIGIIVADQKKTDTITIWDTVVTRDTTKLPRLDTVVIQVTDAPGAPVAVVRDTVPGLKQVVNKTVHERVYITASDIMFTVKAGAVDSVQSIIYRLPSSNAPQTTTNFTIRSDSGDAQIVRTSNLQGATVYEAYSDGDGDGYLFKAAITSPMRSRFFGAYTSGAHKDTIIVLFDAGRDRSFPTTGDNRILSLHREKTVDGRLIERISYGIPSVDSAFDSTSLVIEQNPDYDAIARDHIVYRCVSGSDTLDHRQNRLSRIMKNRAYRSSRVQSLTVEIVPDTSLTASAVFSGGSVFAQVSLGDGHTAIFEGRFDATTGTMRGIFNENGEERIVTYRRASDTYEWEKIK